MRNHSCAGTAVCITFMPYCITKSDRSYLTFSTLHTTPLKPIKHFCSFKKLCQFPWQCVLYDLSADYKKKKKVIFFNNFPVLHVLDSMQYHKITGNWSKQIQYSIIPNYLIRGLWHTNAFGNTGYSNTYGTWELVCLSPVSRFINRSKQWLKKPLSTQ